MSENFLRHKHWWTLFKQRYAAPRLGDSVAALEQWYQSPLGHDLLYWQSQAVSAMLGEQRGRHVLVLSSSREWSFETPGFERQIRAVVGTSSIESVPHPQSCLSQPAFLPFREGSFDAVVIHHVLEFSENPQQILKEVGRVCAPMGLVLIVGFNPVSPAGVAKAVKQSLGFRGLCRRRGLGAGRLRDWLEFIEFSNLAISYVSHKPPLQMRSYLSRSQWLDKFLNASRLPFATCFCLLARKDQYAVRPLRNAWRSEILANALAIPQVMPTPNCAAKRGSKVIINFNKRI